MQDNSKDFVRLQHILKAIQEIEEYTNGRNFSDFLNNSMFRFACIKQLEIIGEASNHITPEMQQRFSKVEWAQIVGMRNVFIHEYFGIDANVAWDIIEFDIPDLKEKIIEIIDNMS